MALLRTLLHFGDSHVHAYLNENIVAYIHSKFMQIVSYIYTISVGCGRILGTAVAGIGCCCACVYCCVHLHVIELMLLGYVADLPRHILFTAANRE